VFGIAAIASGVGQYASSLAFGFYHTTSTAITTPSSIPIFSFIEVLAIVAFCFVNVKGVFLSGKMENVLTIAKVAPLIILAILLLPYIRQSNFHPFYPSSNTDFLKALVIVYFPFTGFEICAIPAEETKGGEKTVFRSIKIVMVLAAFLLIRRLPLLLRQP
jgi:amino acid transporter